LFEYANDSSLAKEIERKEDIITTAEEKFG